MTTQGEISTGVNFQTLSPGSLIDVETHSRHYRIECLGRDLMRISGHPDHCPSPSSALLRGSVDDEGMMEAGFITPGMRLTFFLNDRGPIATSRVIRVQVARAEGKN